MILGVKQCKKERLWLLPATHFYSFTWKRSKVLGKKVTITVLYLNAVTVDLHPPPPSPYRSSLQCACINEDHIC